MHRVKITIKGSKVHDIGYRLFLLDEADIRFIPHFDARNVKIKGEHAVVALAGGDEEKVRDLVEYVKSTPYENAIVSSIDAEDYEGDIRTIDSFRNSFSTRQLFKIANIGVNMLDKQDSTIEILKSVKEDTGKMLDKQDDLKSTVERGFSELKEEHIKTREMSMEIFHSEIQTLKQKINYLHLSVEEIKKKVGIA